MILPPLTLARAPELHGRGMLAGKTPGLLTVNGEPAQRTILVHEARGCLAARTRSAPDGKWMVGYLNMNRRWRVTAIDDLGVHNAVVMDGIQPVLMPEFDVE